MSPDADTVTTEAGPPSGDERAEIGSSGWRLWPWALLRAPGFAADGVSRLASPAAARAADAVAEAGRADAEGEAAYRRTFEQERERLAIAVQDIAREPRFQLALAWQNHHAFETAIEPLLRWKPEEPRNSKHRQHEQLVARYWQRYCVKNDTIGFFGPVGWARIDPAARETTASFGESLVASLDVFFEVWAIDRLAGALAAEPAMERWLAPRRLPFVRLEAGAAVAPSRPPVALSGDEAGILRRCNGRTAAADLADAVLRESSVLSAENEVFELLRQLCRKRLVAWQLELPVGPRPERELRRFLEGVGDPELRETALKRLDAIEAARSEIRRSAADPTALRRALARFDDLFVRLTNTAPSRSSGKSYAGRTLVYHDARRDAEVVLGADVVDALAPVGLLLASARWLTFETARTVRHELREVGRRLAAGTAAAVDLASFWFESVAIVPKVAGEAVDRAEAELQRRWAEILRCPLDRQRVSYAARDLGPRVLEAFAAPSSGWTAARNASPDVLVAAPDLDAVRAGDFELVLGEFHLGLNAARHHCFVTQHPAPNELFDAVDRDAGGPRLLPVLPKEGPGRLSVRTHPALIRAEDHLVALFHHTVDPARPRVHAAVDVAVEEAGEGLVVRLPTGERFDVLDVFSELLMELVIERLRIFGDHPHVPRVSFDRVVVCRETWTFAPTELTFADRHDEAAQFLAARRWRAEVGLPGYVFATCPGEDKPFFVDFESPILVGVLAKAVRRSRRALPAAGGGGLVVVTEMLPSFGQLWLADGAGARYTSEVRMTGVDTAGPVDGGRRARSSRRRATRRRVTARTGDSPW